MPSENRWHFYLSYICRFGIVIKIFMPFWHVAICNIPERVSSYGQAIQKIVKIERYSASIVNGPIEEPNMVGDSIKIRLIRLSEYLKNISIKFKENHNDIPWAEISGFRNRSCMITEKLIIGLSMT